MLPKDANKRCLIWLKCSSGDLSATVRQPFSAIEIPTLIFTIPGLPESSRR